MQRAIFFDLLNQRWHYHTHAIERTHGFVFRTGDGRPPQVAMATSDQSMVVQNPGVFSDGTYPVTRRWVSPLLLGAVGTRSATVLKVAVDYQSNATSALTVVIYRDQGMQSAFSSKVTLAPTSWGSTAEWDFQVSSRYPVVELQSSGQSHTIYRCHVGMALGGS